MQGEWILFGRDACNNSKLFHLYMYDISCMDVGSSKDPFLAQASEFAVLFGNELDAEVCCHVVLLDWQDKHNVLSLAICVVDRCYRCLWISLSLER